MYIIQAREIHLVRPNSTLPKQALLDEITPANSKEMCRAVNDEALVLWERWEQKWILTEFSAGAVLSYKPNLVCLLSDEPTGRWGRKPLVLGVIGVGVGAIIIYQLHVLYPYLVRLQFYDHSIKT